MANKNIELTPKEAQIIRLLADNNMRVKPVAKAMHYNENSINYHLMKVKEATGLDPKKFYDLVELLKMI